VVRASRYRLGVFHRRHGLPENWTDVVGEHLAIWPLLDDESRESVAANADWLLRHKDWEAGRGFALDPEITTTIAALAAVPIIGLTVDHYREVASIIVYASTIVARGVYAGPAPGTVTDGPVPVLGQAHDQRGPVLLAWDEVDAGARHPEHGENVVYHEFAHKLDMLDDLIDGTPPLPSRTARAHWREVCTPVYEAMRRGHERPPLRDYAATNPAEFFAVASESFFCVPDALAHHERPLFDALEGFYAVDPRRWQ